MGLQYRPAATQVFIQTHARTLNYVSTLQSPIRTHLTRRRRLPCYSRAEVPAVLLLVAPWLLGRVRDWTELGTTLLQLHFTCAMTIPLGAFPTHRRLPVKRRHRIEKVSQQRRHQRLAAAARHHAGVGRRRVCALHGIPAATRPAAGAKHKEEIRCRATS